MNQAYDKEQSATPKLICSLVEAVIEFEISIRKLDEHLNGKLHNVFNQILFAPGEIHYDKNI